MKFNICREPCFSLQHMILCFSFVFASIFFFVSERCWFSAFASCLYLQNVCQNSLNNSRLLKLPHIRETTPRSCWESRSKVFVQYTCPWQRAIRCCGVTVPCSSLLITVACWQEACPMQNMSGFCPICPHSQAVRDKPCSWSSSAWSSLVRHSERALSCTWSP